MEYGEKIKIARKENKLTQQELADKLNVKNSTVSKWESNVNMPDIEKVTEMSKIFNKPVDYFFSDSWQGIKLNNYDDIDFDITHIPIIGNIACGDPILSDENIVGYLDFPTADLPKGEIFAMQTHGDSMVPTVPVGAKVIIRQQPTVENGEIAAVSIDGELTLKRVKKINNAVLLVADNSNYDPIILNSDSNNCIIGKAVKVSYDL